jgi:uncharacterized peroxidase-related enzyme
VARIRMIEPEEATGKRKELLDQIKSQFGSVPNGFKVVAASEQALEGSLGFEGALDDGILSDQVREQIGVLVSNMNQCGYCLSAYSAAAGASGVGEEDVAAARQGSASDPKANAILEFARSVVESRGDVSDEDLQRAREAGLDDQELIEIVAVVALKTFTNYYNRLARPELDFPKVEIESMA